MKKKLLHLFSALLLIALGVFIWRLDLPHWKKLDLSKLTDMPGRTTVYGVDDLPVGALQGRENRTWVDIDEIPDFVQNAFIAAEDLRFYRHGGVDVYRLFGALWRDIVTLSYAQGASTITQQLIKLTHLTQTKTLSRKAQEIVLALQLEKAMDKRQILEAYLNAVYFGHGAYGVEAASEVYFGKPISGVTLAEGALLAGIIKSPSSYAPHLDAEKSLARRNSILKTMAENGFITQDECAQAAREELKLVENREEGARYSWYMDAVLSEMTDVLGISADEVISGGYHVYTGLNPAMQQSAEALFADPANFPESAGDGTPVQAALVALDTDNGRINAVIGGRNYDVMRALNRATQMLRQPGSAFKPVSTYAAAIDAYGYLPVSIVDDTPRTFAGGYSPKNAGGNSYGQVTLREALSRSLNIATVALADEIGTSALRTYAARFGLPLAPEDINLSLALGSLTYGVSPAQLASAYCALANGGTRVEPHTIRRILDADGNEVYRFRSEDTRAISAESAYMITDMLRTAAQTGSAKALAACNVPVAGKTGTVSDDYGGTRDIWTVAYTPRTAVAVWMGYDQSDAEHSMPASYGGSGFPARLSAAFLKDVSGDNESDFNRPAGIHVALLDSLALNEDDRALLSTEKTPAEYTVKELFHDYDLPSAFSKEWTTPVAVEDFRLLTGPGEMPVLAFTVQEEHVEYAITRTVNEDSVELAALHGEAGQELRFADDTHDLTQSAEYTVLPRNALLYERGELLAGMQSTAVRYVPGGLLNKLMGVGAADAAPTPAEIEFDPDQSLFS